MPFSEQEPLPISVIASERMDAYRDKVVYTYDDPPETWQLALGPDNLLFQFGLFDPADLAAGPHPGSVGPSELRHFEEQLRIAGLTDPQRPRLARILDLGCGWGHLSRYLARAFPEARWVDAINVSGRQLEYCARRLAGEPDLAGRVRLFLCDGQDVDLLPDPDVPYDLVVVRGVYTHFLNEVFEASVNAVARRLRPGGSVLISDTLYKTPLDRYRPAIPDQVDRLACGNRKSPAYFVGVLEQEGLVVADMRILPSNAEVEHWFQTVRLNIEQNFPHGATGPIEELREMAVSFSVALRRDDVSVYSIIVRRAA